MQLPQSELILHPDGRIYHLNLLPEELADTVITVGDPERVSMVSDCFDTVEMKAGKREFVTHTGHYKGKRLTVLSTGIGTDNIDIVFNELDALVNIDLKRRSIKEELNSLKIIRIGTSGCLDASIPVDSTLLSSYGFGMEGLLNFYNISHTEKELDLLNHLTVNHAEFVNKLPVKAYFSEGSQNLLDRFSSPETYSGITATCSGFYAPQGRQLRLQPAIDSFLDQLANLKLGKERITNFEMETAGIYGLANALGHQALSVNLLIANRATGAFSPNPKQSMQQLIEWSLDKISTI